MIPALDETTGFLPYQGPGASIYNATVDDLRDRFAFNEVRRRRLSRLEAWIEDLDEARVPGRLWISGSFVSAKLAPSDVDVLLVIDANDKTLAKTTISASVPLWTWFNVSATDPRKLTHSRLQPYGGNVDAHYTIDLPILHQRWETDWSTEFDDSGAPTGTRKGFLEVER